MRKSGLIAAASIAACLGMGCDGAADASVEQVGALESDPVAAKPAPAASTPVPTVKIDRSGLGNVGTDKPLDYADPRYWLCRPGNDPDECDANLDSTELLADGTRKIVPHVKAADPEVDCFYVYPTVKLTASGAMTDFSNVEITLDALLAQAARFNEVCRVYAPLYRQNGVVPGAGGAPTPGGGNFNLGANDVRDAFKYYLDKLNNGRKVVLLGHSQGSGMLTQMIAQDVDPKPEVRAKLLSALLIGAGVSVPAGQTVGGTFKNIPTCTEAGQTGCVIAYVSYSKEVPPGPMSTFGRAAGGQQNACTEPAALAGRPGQRYAGSYIRLKRTNASISAPDGLAKLPTDITTPYVLYRDVIRGTCKVGPAGHSYLEIALEQPEGDKRPAPPYRTAAIEAALGLHLVDYNLPLEDLIGAVRLQAASARK